jgi:hypothetical protein
MKLHEVKISRLKKKFNLIFKNGRHERVVSYTDEQLGTLKFLTFSELRKVNKLKVQGSLTFEHSDVTGKTKINITRVE